MRSQTDPESIKSTHHQCRDESQGLECFERILCHAGRLRFRGSIMNIASRECRLVRSRPISLSIRLTIPTALRCGMWTKTGNASIAAWISRLGPRSSNIGMSSSTSPSLFRSISAGRVARSAAINQRNPLNRFPGTQPGAIPETIADGIQKRKDYEGLSAYATSSTSINKVFVQAWGIMLNCLPHWLRDEAEAHRHAARFGCFCILWNQLCIKCG